MHLETLTDELLLFKTMLKFNSLARVQICNKIPFNSLKSIRIQNIGVSLKENQVNKTHLNSTHFTYQTLENSCSLF